jgi:hypothetical protein
VPPTFEFAGRRIPHRSHTERFLQDFESASSTNSKLLLPRLPITGFKCWDYAAPLPSRKSVLEWRPDEGPALLGRRITQRCRFADSLDAARPVQRRSAKGKQSVINTQWAAQSQVISSHQCPADCTDQGLYGRYKARHRKMPLAQSMRRSSHRMLWSRKKNTCHRLQLSYTVRSEAVS